MSALLKFDVQVYGKYPPSESHTCPGVMRAYTVEGESAQAVAEGEALAWKG